MNEISHDREHIARLLPGPAEQEIPRDRHRRIRESMMNQIQDSQPARPRKGLFVGLTATGVAMAAAVAVTAVVVSIPHDAEPARGGSTSTATAAMTGPQILLAAATKAERAPATTGTYWHVKTISKDKVGGKVTTSVFEYWVTQDGRKWWWRGAKTQGRVQQLASHPDFSIRIAGHNTNVSELNKLPTEPGALKSWIVTTVKNDPTIRTSAGRLTGAMFDQAVLDGLLGLVSTLPASPRVRAAAFRAIAAYPGVHAAGTVAAGQALVIPMAGQPTKLVVDPTTGLVRETNVLVTLDGAQLLIPAGSTASVVADWTNNLPQ